MARYFPPTYKEDSGWALHLSIHWNTLDNKIALFLYWWIPNIYISYCASAVVVPTNEGIVRHCCKWNWCIALLRNLHDGHYCRGHNSCRASPYCPTFQKWCSSKATSATIPVFMRMRDLHGFPSPQRKTPQADRSSSPGSIELCKRLFSM